jgi:unspecific monooxygenase
MKPVDQSPTDPDFVQNPYPFYDTSRQQGDLVYWADYKMPAAMGYEAVNALLKDHRFGRQKPAQADTQIPIHLRDFQRVEQHSMLEHDGAQHKRLRSQVLRAFTSRRIDGLGPKIETLCDTLIDDFPNGPFDLLKAYCTILPVTIIARLLGVDETRAPDLLRWSNTMVAMYQAGRTRDTEEAANRAAKDFTEFLIETLDQKRNSPGNDLISHLLTHEDSDKLSKDELIGTCVLLLNAGHEATVHSLGNAVRCLIGHGTDKAHLEPDKIAQTVEELLRFDPPLHMFTRIAQESCEVFGHTFQTGDEVALMLAAANRDPARWADPNRFDPTRAVQTHTSLGAGAHFCVGAPLARLELQIGLRKLFERCPNLKLSEQPNYANSYHFHGLTRLMVEL